MAFKLSQLVTLAQAGLNPIVIDGQVELPPGVELGEAQLALLKQVRSSEIDARTEQLIAQGFAFGGKRFSLSQNAQIKWIGMVVGAAGISYPCPVPTIDNSDTLLLQNAGEVQQLYATAMGTVASHIGAGTAIKAQVLAAATLAELDAVEDSR